MDPLIFPNTLFPNTRISQRNFAEPEQSKFLSYDPSVPSTILSQHLWFNKHVKIGNNSAYFSHFSNHGTNLIGNLVDINGRYKSWDTIKYEYNLTDREKF